MPVLCTDPDKLSADRGHASALENCWCEDSWSTKSSAVCVWVDTDILEVGMLAHSIGGFGGRVISTVLVTTKLLCWSVWSRCEISYRTPFDYCGMVPLELDPRCGSYLEPVDF